MYKNYNMTQLTLPIETSVRIPQNDISRYVNEIVETIPESEFDEFRHHLVVFIKLYESVLFF
ncbi:hypothetical protein [Staphylococcus aureus]|uniref:hypothetical protein n=1 Tax=Staphylococcus aureus TaxID=1280 RepID=UPI00132F4C6A|nr:hypothetical protein [Staphylococcus aureus]QHG79684.1 hypothetical protein D7B62_10405 [Staphylococcus aureus]